MDTVINFLKSFAEELNSRAKSRWLTCFLMSWLIYNWKRLVVLIFTDNRSIELVQNTICDMISVGSVDCWSITRDYGIIVLFTIFWIYGRPLLDSLIDSTQHWVKKRFKVEAKSTMMKRENMSTHKYYMDQERYDSHFAKLYNEEYERRIEAEDKLTRYNLNEMNSDTPILNYHAALERIYSRLTYELINNKYYENSLGLEKIAELQKTLESGHQMYNRALDSIRNSPNPLT